MKSLISILDQIYTNTKEQKCLENEHILTKIRTK